MKLCDMMVNTLFLSATASPCINCSYCCERRSWEAWGRGGDEDVLSLGLEPVGWWWCSGRIFILIETNLNKAAAAKDLEKKGYIEQMLAKMRT